MTTETLQTEQQHTNPPEWLLNEFRRGQAQWSENEDQEGVMLIQVCRNCQSGQPSCICNTAALDWIPVWRRGQGTNERLVKYLKNKKAVHSAEKGSPQFKVHTAEEMKRRITLWSPVKGVPSRHIAAAYMRKLFAEGDRVLVQLIHGTKTYMGKDEKPHACTEEYPRSLADATDEAFIQTLKEKNAEGWNIYITMNPIQKESKHRRKTDIAEIRSVYCEADANGQECLNAMREAVRSGEIPEPSYIVQSSPLKYHFIWFVKDFAASQQEALNKALVEKFKTDPESVDCSRVLRLPDFYNRKPKYDTPPLATVFFESTTAGSVRYSPSDFKIDMEIKSAVPMGETAPPEIVRAICEVIEEALTKADIKFTGCETKGTWIYEYLFVCPNPLHTTVDRYRSVSVRADGVIGSNCYHSNCDGNDWKWLRAWLEETNGAKMRFPKPVERKDETPEDTKATSLLVFKTAADVEIACRLGFHAITADDFKAPLDPAFNRVVLFNSNEEVFRKIAASIEGQGCICAGMPRDSSRPKGKYGHTKVLSLTEIPIESVNEHLTRLINSDAIRQRSVRKPRTRLVEVPADANVTVTNGVVSETSQIPAFDTSVMEGSIYGKFVELVTAGTTLQPQYAYQMARLTVSMLIAGRVAFENLADVPPLRRLVFLGDTGSGKGESYRRSKYVLTMGGRQTDKNFKITESVDSGAGLKDMFFDEPVGLPVFVYVDEVMTLGHKSSDKKNPDILDVMGELANSTTVSRTLSTGGGGGKKKASKTINDAHLFWVMCAPDGMTFMSATAGRKTAGFNDRNIPVFGVPVVPDDLPIIPVQAIADFWVELYKIQTMVGTQEKPGTVTMTSEAKILLETFWKAQPEPIQKKVRFKQYLQLDAYLNAVGRGRMTVLARDAEDAIKDSRRELSTRAICFQEEAGDRVGFYYASLKRITVEMEATIRKAGLVYGDDLLFEYGKSEKEFEHDTRAQANNEPDPFARAWKHWSRTHLEPLPPRKAKNGRMVTRYVPARSERE